MSNTAQGILSIFTAVVGVAIVAVLVSKQSQTGTVLKTVFDGFNQALSTAVSPISGGK